MLYRLEIHAVFVFKERFDPLFVFEIVFLKEVKKSFDYREIHADESVGETVFDKIFPGFVVHHPDLSEKEHDL